MAKQKGQQVVPEEAKRYFRQKKLTESWDYREIWRAEHATAFTVAKTTNMDVLEDLHEAMGKAIAEGQSWQSFQRSGIAETLQSKGWWGKDPKTGAQLGSARRLQVIYETNMRQAYNSGRFAQGMASDAHPYILYRLGPSRQHRRQHAAW